jgi:hypothetical protein
MKMRMIINHGLRNAMIVIALLGVISLVSNADAFSSKKSRKNGVTVDVKPMKFISGQPAKFKVRMNTHSVELEEDMTAVATLSDDQGREYTPVKWDGAGPSGHHRSGTLVFPILEGTPKSVTLVIRDIAKVPERVFQWNLED